MIEEVDDPFGFFTFIIILVGMSISEKIEKVYEYWKWFF
jgi:hypothetical protein